jgi:hypothetical protein
VSRSNPSIASADAPIDTLTRDGMMLAVASDAARKIYEEESNGRSRRGSAAPAATDVASMGLFLTLATLLVR